jgi:hypothetical protein
MTWTHVTPLGWACLGVAAACVLVSLYSLLLARRARRAFLEMSRETALAYGSLVADSGRQFPVSGLTLRRGMVVISFALTGPLDAGPERLTLTGTDAQSVTRVDIDLPDLKAGAVQLATGYLEISS